MAAHLVNAIARAIANTPADVAKRLNLGTSESAELPRALSGRVLAWALLVCLETMILAAPRIARLIRRAPHMSSLPTFNHCPGRFLASARSVITAKQCGEFSARDDFAYSKLRSTSDRYANSYGANQC